MREAFFGYYPPTKQDYERLWGEALIVLDTNVLLDLYRLPKEARDEFFDVLDALKDRLWLPYQVALEFQRRRLTVIAAERKGTEAALELAGNFVSQVSEKVNLLQMEKHALGLDPKPLIKDLESANQKVIEAIKAVHNSQLDIASSDPIRERLDSIVRDKIGPPPASQPDVDELIANGEDRYKGKVPPGFSDATKDRNPNEAEFVHDGLVYQRKFGDLILWRQLLKFAKANGVANVLFVTSDKKEDWWWREQGKTSARTQNLLERSSDLPA